MGASISGCKTIRMTGMLASEINLRGRSPAERADGTFDSIRQNYTCSKIEQCFQIGVLQYAEGSSPRYTPIGVRFRIVLLWLKTFSTGHWSRSFVKVKPGAVQKIKKRCQIDLNAAAACFMAKNLTIQSTAGTDR